METNNYSEYADEDLPRAWNHLETCELTEDIERRMDAIFKECESRGIWAWDSEGNITHRRD